MAKAIRHPGYGGFTFVELMLGIIVSSIVLMTLAVFTFGVSDNWMQSDSSQSTFLTESTAVERISNIVRQSQSIEPVPTNGSMDLSTPSAACVMWIDSNGDGNIQYSELTMLQYLPASRTVVQWTIPPNSLVYLPTLTSPLMSEDQFMHLTPSAATIAENVIGCQFFSVPGVNNSTQMMRPSLEVLLKCDTSNPGLEPQTVYATISLRAPRLNAQSSP